MKEVIYYKGSKKKSSRIIKNELGLELLNLRVVEHNEVDLFCRFKK